MIDRQPDGRNRSTLRRNAARLGVVSAIVIAVGGTVVAADRPAVKSPQTVREALWVWGNPEMGQPGEASAERFAHATSRGRAKVLGTPNVLMAGSGLPENAAEALSWTNDVGDAPRLVWEIMADGQDNNKPPFEYKQRISVLKPLVKRYPQIEAVLIDDMTSVAASHGFLPEHLRGIKDELKKQELPLDLWGVLYTMNFPLPGTDPLVRELDVINLWHWHAKDTANLEANVAECERRYPGKPIVAGLYLYDYGDGRRMPLDIHEAQCETALKLLKEQRIRGIVFLSINDDPEVVKWTADWIKRVGDEPLAAATGAPPTEKPAPDGARLFTTARKEMVAKGAAFSAITALNDGSLALTVQRAKALDELDSSNVGIEWLRSTDGGETWSEPTLIYRPLAEDGKLFRRRPDQGYEVFQARNQAIGQLPDGRMLCSFCVLNYQYTPSGDEEPRPGVAWNHENQGLFCTWSDDDGRTWTKPTKIDIAPFGGPRPMVSPHWWFVSLPDGTVLMSLYGSRDPQYKGPLTIPDDAQTMSGVLRSTDRGETWGDPTIIMSKAGDLPWEENALRLLDDGTLLGSMRTERHSVDQYSSTDGGRTWSGPTPFTEPGQQPGGVLQLKSGLLVGTWGNRREPYGAAAMVSRDRGQSWDFPHRVSLEWESPNANCGYANAAQAGDGTIVVTYYIMGEYSTYRALWDDSRVFISRFTEDELLQAMSNQRVGFP